MICSICALHQHLNQLKALRGEFYALFLLYLSSCGAQAPPKPHLQPGGKLQTTFAVWAFFCCVSFRNCTFVKGSAVDSIFNILQFSSSLNRCRSKPSGILFHFSFALLDCLLFEKYQTELCLMPSRPRKMNCGHLQFLALLNT